MSRSQLFLRVAFWAALVFSLVMALLPQPPRLPGDPPDTILHVLAFMTLTALALAAFPALSRLRLAIRLSAFGAMIELCQMIPVLNRDAQLLDWIADTGAVIIVLLAGAWLRLPRLR